MKELQCKINIRTVIAEILKEKKWNGLKGLGLYILLDAALYEFTHMNRHCLTLGLNKLN